MATFLSLIKGILFCPPWAFQDVLGRQTRLTPWSLLFSRIVIANEEP